jgi:hypothetical protein
MMRGSWLLTLILLLAIATPVRGQAACASPWKLQESFRIGSASGDVDLVAPTSIAVGPDGRIYLSDALIPTIQVLSSAGRPERTIGRAGQGPGEFQGGIGQLGFRGDTLWVYDENSTDFFLPSGRLAFSVSFRVVIPAEASSFTPGIPLADGSFFGRRAVIGLELDSYAARQRQMPTRRFSRTGAILGTIISLDWRNRYVRLAQESRALRTDVFLTHPLFDRVNTAPGGSSPSGVPSVDGRSVVAVGDVVYGPRATFDLVRVGLLGDTLVKRQVGFTPIAISRAEVDSITKWFAAEWAGDYRPKDMGGRPPPSLSDPTRIAQKRRDASEALSFPRYKPPVRSIEAGIDGTVWLLREFRLDGVERWEVYDPELRLLGAVELKASTRARLPWLPAFEILRASDSEVWGVTRDVLEVPMIVRYTVNKVCGTSD